MMHDGENKEEEAFSFHDDVHFQDDEDDEEEAEEEEVAVEEWKK